MLVTESGMVTDCKDEHPENVRSPMLVTESEMVTDCKESQPSNARTPMLVTESGMVTDCKEEQWSVFASYCISIYFLLNGRKVIT